MQNQIDHTVAVAVFVIIPSDQLDESIAQLNASLGIEHTASSAADEIGRHNLNEANKKKEIRFNYNSNDYNFGKLKLHHLQCIPKFLSIVRFGQQP